MPKEPGDCPELCGKPCRVRDAPRFAREGAFMVDGEHFEAVTLSDGRRVSYVSAGDPGGRPIVYFEGSPGHVRLRERDSAAAAATGVRVILVHRPGYRGSDAHSKRTMLDWARDVEAVADALHLDEFAVMGQSMGGGHALACGYALQPRVTTVAIASGHAPLDLAGAMAAMGGASTRLFRIGRRAPWLITPIMRAVSGKAGKDPAGFLDSSIDGCPPSEAALYDAEFRDMVVTAIAEQAERGSPGIIGDTYALVRPWGFDPAGIHVPVSLWYGTADAGSTPPNAVSCSRNSSEHRDPVQGIGPSILASRKCPSPSGGDPP
jgi:pimeloyl-ACP methyl ester carboxylesterase